MNPSVDFYFAKSKQWQAEMEQLRTIVLDCGLTEELKWGVPCYTADGKNMALIHQFKEYCALLFVKGSLLDDPEQILVAQTENTQAARQVRFTTVQAILDLELVLKRYLQQAIDQEKAGLKVAFDKTALVYPEELQQKLADSPALKAAFEKLTPGRQRAYVLHFSAPKQAKTREARIEKYRQYILAGKGLMD